MKINLYCDVLMVPPEHLVKERKEHVYVERFVKTISMTALLVPGQTYQVKRDPVTGNPDPNAFEVMDSGVFEDGTRQIPYMVVKDDYWLAFEPWLKYECEVHGNESELVTLWRQEDEKELEQVKWRFQNYGWKICPFGKLEPTRSCPDFRW